MDLPATLTIKTKEEADAWMAKTLEFLRNALPGLSDEAWTALATESVAVFALANERVRVEKLFGKLDPSTSPAPGSALMMGMEIGKRMAGVSSGPAVTAPADSPTISWPLHGLHAQPWRNVSGTLAVREFPPDDYMKFANAVDDVANRMLKVASDRDACAAETVVAALRAFTTLWAGMDGESHEIFEGLEEMMLVQAELKLSSDKKERVHLPVDTSQRNG